MRPELGHEAVRDVGVLAERAFDGVPQEGQVVDPSVPVDALEGPLLIIKVRLGSHEEVALALLRRRGERVP